MVYGNIFIVVVIIKMLFLDVKEVFMIGVIFKFGCVIVFYFCVCGICVLVIYLIIYVKFLIRI